VPGFFTHRHVLQPGQRVAVFPYDAASGATIGHYGTVIHAHADSVRQNPHWPNAWRYRVSTSAGPMDVEGCDILPLGSVETSFLRKNSWPEYELCFQSPLSTDNDEIQGFCRIAGRYIGYFKFRKEAQRIPSYRLSLLATRESGMPWAIKYRVPADCRLDRPYVLCALAEILGDDPLSESQRIPAY
jgi:hypothetical protein